jgi:hypothetical protein
MRSIISFLCLVACWFVCVNAQPYLYVTFHGGKNGVQNIYSYDLSGNLINQNVLSGTGADEAKGMFASDMRISMWCTHLTLVMN